MELPTMIWLEMKPGSYTGITTCITRTADEGGPKPNTRVFGKGIPMMIWLEREPGSHTGITTCEWDVVDGLHFDHTQRRMLHRSRDGRPTTLNA